VCLAHSSSNSYTKKPTAASFSIPAGMAEPMQQGQTPALDPQHTSSRLLCAESINRITAMHSALHGALTGMCNS
jgi:hypothetical protein